MRALFIHSGHNSTVAYYDNGSPKYVFQEERLRYQKNYTGLPTKSIDEIFKKIDSKIIDKIIFTSIHFSAAHLPNQNENFDKTLKFTENSFLKIRSIYEFFEYNFNFFNLITSFKDLIRKYVFHPLVKTKIEKYLRNNYSIDANKILYYDHHLCHALSPMAFYDVDESKKILAISFDGEGDFSSGKTFLINKNQHKLLNDTHYKSSLGYFYSSITKFLGFKVNEHEYKIMGIAAYGKKNKFTEEIYNLIKDKIWFDAKDGTIKSKFNIFLISNFIKSLRKNFRFDNLSYAFQIYLEDIVLSYINFYVDNYKPEILCFSGGVFMNVKLNQKISEMFPEKKIYFQPSSGDESLFLGGSYKFYKDNSIKLKSMKSVYFGRDISDNLDKKILDNELINKNFEIKKKVENDMNDLISDKLKDNNIIGYVKNRSEWGARSLCNRALLCNPSNYSNYSKLNNMIKKRDFWMPFAPVILNDYANEYLENWENLKNSIGESSKHMTLTFNTKKKNRDKIICAIHSYDNTCRPQIVSEEDNMEIYKLLKEFKKKTGSSVLLNTSLNLHGKPTNDILEHVIDTALNSELEYLVINDYFLKKVNE